jgi:hypothetical protein
MFRTTALALCLLCAPWGALAQDPTPEPAPGIDESLELFSEGARRLLEGLNEELGPLLQDLGDRIEDLNAYEAPEILPNGDILIRRKPETAPDPDMGPTPPDSDAPIEL